MNDVYSRIEHLCKGKNLDITTMCKEAEVSRAALSEFKMGRTKKLSTATLAKIADYFDVSVDYLLGKTDNTKVAVAAAIPQEYHEVVFTELRKLGVEDVQIKQDSPRAKVAGEGFIVDDVAPSDAMKIAKAIEMTVKGLLTSNTNVPTEIDTKETPATTEGDGLDSEIAELIKLYREASPEMQAAALGMLEAAERARIARDSSAGDK